MKRRALCARTLRYPRHLPVKKLIPSLLALRESGQLSRPFLLAVFNSQEVVHSPESPQWSLCHSPPTHDRGDFHVLNPILMGYGCWNKIVLQVINTKSCEQWTRKVNGSRVYMQCKSHTLEYMLCRRMGNDEKVPPWVAIGYPAAQRETELAGRSPCMSV